MLNMTTKTRLTLLPMQLYAAGYENVKPYLSIKDQALNCGFKAYSISGRWYFDPADLDDIAAALGLRKATKSREAA